MKKIIPALAIATAAILFTPSFLSDAAAQSQSVSAPKASPKKAQRATPRYADTSCHTYGGYGARGKVEAEADRIVADAQAVAESGAFAMVVEGVIEPLAQRITETVSVPTIGIGASAACDGQILVCDDLLGLFGDFRPKFVKQYAQLAGTIEAAVGNYASDVRARRFPGPEQVYAAGKGSRTSEPQ